MKVIAFDPEILIIEVEKRPALWDISCSQYDDRHVRNKCWKELVDIFTQEEEVSNAEKMQKLVSSLQAKWKSIRASFTREENRQLVLESGSISSRKSEYIYFNRTFWRKLAE